MSIDYAQRRDANERPIIEALRAGGVFVEQMPVGAGFDLLCAKDGRLELMEVKPVGVYKFTDAEISITKALADHGIELWVVRYPEQALAVFGLV